MTEMINDEVIFWPQGVVIGEVLYPPGGAYGPRQQIDLQLVLIHTGEMTVWVDGVRRYAPAGTVSVLFPGHEEQFAFAQASETWHSYIHLRLPELPAPLEARLRRLPWPLPLSQTMSDLIFSGLALRGTAYSTTSAMLKALAVQMIWRYIGEGERLLAGTASSPTHPAVERARQFIQMRLGEPLSLELLAQAASVSPAHLIRLFQAEMQTTPMAYVWERRVGLGIELLENTGLAVGIIAERCGFQTSYHFSRRVRQMTGLTPLEVRRRAWQRN